MGRKSSVLNELVLPHGTLPLPTFLPDATRAVVRSIDSADLENCGIDAVVMNTFHLMQRPGSSTIHTLGGLHQMAGWQRPIVTDSGGFQIYSLIRQNSSAGSISSRGATFQVEKGARKFQLAPEKSIQLQMAYGADVIFCLDDPTHVSDPYDEQVRSVERTLDWAKRSRREYDSLLKQKRLPPERRPLLFAIIQGGDRRDLRRHCADVLLEIGFDGYGYGGWPLDDAGKLVEEALAYTRELVPPELPLHGLGVASPTNVTRCAALGYDLFDGAMPTRDAATRPPVRHPAARVRDACR